jgi:hypothetical protein
MKNANHAFHLLHGSALQGSSKNAEIGLRLGLLFHDGPLGLPFIRIAAAGCGLTLGNCGARRIRLGRV